MEHKAVMKLESNGRTVEMGYDGTYHGLRKLADSAGHAVYLLANELFREEALRWQAEKLEETRAEMRRAVL